MQDNSFYVVTLGCDKNSIDSEAVGRLLEEQGYSEVSDPQNARIIIVNTCGFIDIARAESISTLQTLASSKSPDQILIAAGCLAEIQSEQILAEVPGVSAAIGSSRLGNISSIIASVEHGIEPPTKPLLADDWLSTRRKAESATAFIKIAEGCDSACSFCAIPLIKGPYRSKPVERVVDEALQLVQQDVKEIILIAQDTSLYGQDLPAKPDLPALISEVLAAVPSLPWLRLMYTYPQRITTKLLELMSSSKQICHYLDMPLQHSHPAVLKRMGRPADIDKTKEMIRNARSLMPDIALRTTLIAGYPGETDEEFRHLLNFVKEMKFDHLGVFAYSQEYGTKAADLPGQLPEKIKERRLNKLLETQQHISLKKNQAFIGRTMPVLIEGLGEVEVEGQDNEPIAAGRACRHAPEVDGLVFVSGPAKLNEIAIVKIHSATEYDLWADVQ